MLNFKIYIHAGEIDDSIFDKVLLPTQESGIVVDDEVVDDKDNGKYEFFDGIILLLSTRVKLFTKIRKRNNKILISKFIL